MDIVVVAEELRWPYIHVLEKGSILRNARLPIIPDLLITPISSIVARKIVHSVVGNMLMVTSLNDFFNVF